LDPAWQPPGTADNDFPATDLPLLLVLALGAIVVIGTSLVAFRRGPGTRS